MSTQRLSLADACTEKNLRHELYYGDVYRIKTTVDAQKEGWRDVLRISIPFSPKKEVEFMRRFHVDRSELDDFYKNLIQAVSRHEAISKALLESDAESLKKSAIDYTTAEVIVKDEQDPKKGVDIFLVQNMADPFTKTAEFNSSGTNLNTVLNLGIRMLAIIKQMAEHNMTMGVIDIDSLFLESNTEGEKPSFTLKNGFFFYSTMPGKKPPVLTKDTEPYVLPYLYSGDMEQDANTDVYMLCKLLWVILDGKHYADDCSVDINTDPQPKYAPDDLYAALKAGMDTGYAAYKQLNTVLRSISKQIKTGVRENVRINFAAPSYLAFPLPEMRPEEKKEEEPQEDEVDTAALEAEKLAKEQEEKRKKKKKILIAIPIFLITLLAVAFALFGPSGPLNYLVAAPVETEPTEATEAVIKPRSSEKDLYAGKKTVLHKDGSKAEGYGLDRKGNLIDSNTKEIIYEASEVDPYLYIENVSIGIKDKTYEANIDDTEPLLKERVIDARETEVIYKNHGDNGDLIRDLIKKHSLKQGDILLLFVEDADTSYRAIRSGVFYVENIATLEDEEETTPAEEPEYPTGTVNGPGSYAVYADASWGHKTDESIKGGETVTVYEKKNNSGSDWVRIGDDRWMHASNVTVDGEIPEAEVEDTEEDENGELNITLRYDSSKDVKDVFKAQGLWRYTLQVSMAPDAFDKKLTITTEDPDGMLFYVETENGPKLAKSVKVTGNTDGIAEVTVQTKVEGKYVLKVESQDGNLNKRLAVNFERTNSSLVPTEEPPDATTAPTEAPTTPTTPPRNTWASGGGGGGSSSTYSPPVSTPQTEPTTAYVEEAWTCDIYLIQDGGQSQIGSGMEDSGTVYISCNVGDTLAFASGNPMAQLSQANVNAPIQSYLDGPNYAGAGIVTSAENFRTYTAIAPGECEIWVSKGATGSGFTVVLTIN